MPLPNLAVEGDIACGRLPVTLEELEDFYVDSAQFAGSSTRGAIFEDFLSLLELVRSYGDALIESVWVGGSFASSKLDPEDIDCLLLLSAPAFEPLSNRKKRELQRFNVKNHIKQKLELKAEGFVVVREPIANPWAREAGTVKPEAVVYTSIRGAWDDWWLRTRVPGEDEPSVQSSHPTRGYPEVQL